VNELERYLFDLHGFLVIENALDADLIAALNARIDQEIEVLDQLLAAQAHNGDTTTVRACEQDKPWTRFDGLLRWGKPFQSLIDPPQLSPYLSELLGQNFRLDHDYVHIIRQPGTGPIGSILHGGGTPYDPCQYYHFRNGRMYNGLTAVMYNLTDVAIGQGGFGCIPGSHKSNLPLPDAMANLEHPHPCVQEIAGKAGTAIIFTEALTHGTLFWKGPHERRTLFYKYSPHPSAWLRQSYNPQDYDHLTPAQRDRLKAPGVQP
jgi:ectoine hydroxylase-related dioxygenase (phytanoyl-CoA dioxygenase family)